MTDQARAEREMCRHPLGHEPHIWFRANGEPRWCGGVTVARWYNVVVEQQGRDRQAEQ